MTVFLACPVSSRFEIILLNQANYLLKDSKELQQLKNANYKLLQVGSSSAGGVGVNKEIPYTVSPTLNS